jgi:ubiquinone/menaquinone biosynthesis C-methylase UbiE
LSELLPHNASVLDVGCGDGLIAQQIMEKRGDLTVKGIDVMVRPQTHIPVEKFDGRKIPYADASFDAVMFVDVLHHTDDPFILLQEARRVSRQAVVIKDHIRQGFLAGQTLRFMDWVGNARHGVVLPYNYWTLQQWTDAFSKLGWRLVENRTRLGLYPPPASWVFERSLHFIARLEP